MKWLLVAPLLLTACFDPDLKAGGACADGKCPGSLVCDLASNTCMFPGVIDGGIDASGSLIDAEVCVDAYPYQVSNIDLCDIPDQPTLLDFSSVPTYVIDTSNGTLTPEGQVAQPLNGVVVAQPGANTPDIYVVRVTSLLIPLSALVQVVGARALLVVSDQDIQVNGLILANGLRNAAGAGAGTCVAANGAGGTVDGAGGGGGGYGELGGNGGPGGTTGGGETPGGAIVGASAIIPLMGGCSGGIGAPAINGGLGGGGGGAIQLTTRAALSVGGGGAIRANGGGGLGGLAPGDGNSGGGGGGGAGGSILLEGDTITIAALSQLKANGGGGAQGSYKGDNIGGDGCDGEAGGAGGGPACANGHNNGGNGGAGGTIARPAQVGAAGVGGSDTAGGGGGGGSVGRITLRTVSGTAAVNSGEVSPSPTYLTQ